MPSFVGTPLAEEEVAQWQADLAKKVQRDTSESAERRRKRQRESYRNRYQNDAGFADRECKRQQERYWNDQEWRDHKLALMSDYRCAVAGMLSNMRSHRNAQLGGLGWEPGDDPQEFVKDYLNGVLAAIHPELRHAGGQRPAVVPETPADAQASGRAAP
jgi:hypothetical protein